MLAYTKSPSYSRATAIRLTSTNSYLTAIACLSGLFALIIRATNSYSESNRLLIWRRLQLTIRATRKLLNISVQFSSPSIKEAATAAVTSLGYAELKSHQARVIEKYVSGHDSFGVLPIDYGKSLRVLGNSLCRLSITAANLKENYSLMH